MNFRFPSKSLRFTANNGHYIPKNLCYSTNGLLFTMNYSYRYLPVSAVLSVHYRGCGVLCAQSVLSETMDRGGYQ